MSRYIDADALMAKIDGIIEYIETEIEQAKQHPEKYARTYIPSAVSQLSGIAHAQQEILEAPTAELHDCNTCRYNNLKWYEEPCDSCTGGGKTNHWKPSAEPEWNNHTVACLLAEMYGDDCACNFNGIDEWLPEKCEVIDSCPNPVGVACWEQFLKHRAERKTDE